MTVAAQTRSLGRWTLLAPLGSGAQGEVFQARHEDGREGAVKLLGERSAAALLAFRREIQAIEELQHPGVVQLLDRGVVDARPWYAMELCRGGTLAHLAPPRRYDRAGLGRLLGIARRLCAALAYVHGEGVIHQDLKPGNVFLEAGDQPVLVDFGLMRRAGTREVREVLDSGSTTGGTLGYMAPELLLGQQVDARADLYSVGCILFELLSGRTPFGGSRGELLRAHLSARPPDLRRLRPDLDDALVRLVEALLAKQPEARPSYAEEVAQRLIALGADRADPQPTPACRQYLYRASFTGRPEAVAQADRLFEQARQGGGPCLWIGGESGVGKTRLASEISRRAQLARGTVVAGVCVNPRGSVGSGPHGGPLHPFRPLLRAVADRCLAGGPAVTEALLGPRRAVLAEYEPSLAALPGQPPTRTPEPLDAGAARARLFRFLGATLEAFFRERPGLLVLDDLQWADPTTLDFLSSLLSERRPQLRCLLLLTYRSEEFTEDLQALVAEEHPQLQLTRFGDGDIANMVASMLAIRPAPAPLVSFLVRQSEGNPLFVGEYLRLAVARGALARTRSGWELDEAGSALAGMPLPGNLRELIAFRFEGLDALAHETLGLAAAIGRRFHVRTVLDALGGDEAAALAGLRQLLRRGLVVDEGEQLGFSHDKLREAAYQRLPADEIAALHRRVAEALERSPGAVMAQRAMSTRAGAEGSGASTSSRAEGPLRGDAQDLELAANLGRHWSRAGDAERALPWLREAARRSSAVHAYDDASSYLRASLEQLQRHSAPPAGLEAELLEQLGDTLAIRGQYDEAGAVFAQLSASASVEDRVLRARLLRKRGRALDSSFKNDEAQLLLRAAEQELGDEPEEDADAWLHEAITIKLHLALALYFLARTDDDEFDWANLARLVRRNGDARQQAEFYVTRCTWEMRKERYALSDDTTELAVRALEAAEKGGDVAQIAHTVFVLGYARLMHDEPDAADRLLRRALAHARRAGDKLSEMRSLTYLTLAHRRLRDPDAVERYARPCLAVSEEVGVGAYIATARAQLGWIAWRRGDLAEAHAELAQADALWTQGVIVWGFRWLALLPLIALAADDGDWQKAGRDARAVLAPPGQRLPESLTVPLSRFIATVEGGGEDLDRRARRVLREALREARRLGYL